MLIFILFIKLLYIICVIYILVYTTRFHKMFGHGNLVLSPGNPLVNMCMNMCINMCMNMCINMCMNMCINMCINMLIHMFVYFKV